jgi:hypothetical protein
MSTEPAKSMPQNNVIKKITIYSDPVIVYKRNRLGDLIEKVIEPIPFTMCAKCRHWIKSGAMYNCTCRCHIQYR